MSAVMRQSGESIRVVHPLFQEAGGGSIPTSPLQLHVGEVTLDLAMRLNELWHSRFPLTDKTNLVRVRYGVNFAAEYEGKFYAVAIWTSPIASNRLKDGLKALELRRLAIAPDSPKNTASRVLSVMTRLIKGKGFDINRFISYQDTGVHKGTIYKAAGWQSVGEQGFQEWSTDRRKRAPSQSNAPKVRWELSL